MITQETKPEKTWGGFNLAILKVNLNPLFWKNRSSYNKTYKPPQEFIKLKKKNEEKSKLKYAI